MHRSTSLPLLLGAAMLLASCGETASPATPTQLTTSSSVSVRAQALAPPRIVPFPTCPIATPFFLPVAVTVTPTGIIVVVTSISTQFTDTTGIQMPQVTLPAPLPTTQFGTALDQARGAQTFPLNLCQPVPQGTVIVTVNTRDTSGRTGSSFATLAVQ